MTKTVQGGELPLGHPYKAGHIKFGPVDGPGVVGCNEWFGYDTEEGDRFCGEPEAAHQPGPAPREPAPVVDHEFVQRERTSFVALIPNEAKGRSCTFQVEDWVQDGCFGQKRIMRDCGRPASEHRASPASEDYRKRLGLQRAAREDGFTVGAASPEAAPPDMQAAMLRFFRNREKHTPLTVADLEEWLNAWNREARSPEAAPSAASLAKEIVQEFGHRCPSSFGHSCEGTEQELIAEWTPRVQAYGDARDRQARLEATKQERERFRTKLLMYAAGHPDAAESARIEMLLHELGILEPLS